MRNLDSITKSELTKQENKPIYLYTLFNYDGAGNNLRFAEADADITFDGLIYQRFPVTHEFIGENTGGEIDTVTIRIANVSRLIQSYLELYDLRKTKVTIALVWANQLSNPTAKIVHTFYIDGIPSANEMDVSFTLSSKFNALDLRLPKRRYSRHHCEWTIFKGTECGYAGAGTSCNKTLQQCQAYLNQLRFGGEPSVPSRRIFF
ncbi:MAG: DUF2163 domain-containing protein [Candidatus Omnitrophica bacterium]|nr:DUF2163 domain-containing protein [Candidatus Omnitrophota bacterium]